MSSESYRGTTSRRCARRLALPARLAAVTAAACILAAMFSPSAFADPIAVKKAQAAAVESQVEALNNKAEIAAENYDTARDRYDQLTARVQATERKISKLKKHQGSLQRTLDSRANVMYRQGPLGFLPLLLSARTFSDFDATFQMLVNIGRNDAITVAQLKQAKRDAIEAHTTLVASQSEARAQKREMAANEKAVRTHLAEQRTLLAGINSDIKQLIAQKKAAEAAAAHRRLLALLARQRAEAAAARARHYASKSSGSNDVGGSPPPSGKGAAAVYWAEKALGKPYVWAADGPDSFDCSGLVMWAYGHVGVSLPHSSREQIHHGARVSRSNLQPGDLVFFGSPIHHVGMYVGGGDFIEAPYTGANVRISALSNRGDYAGACRP